MDAGYVRGLTFFPLHAPRLTLAAIAIATVVLAVCARDLRFESSIQDLVSSDTAGRHFYEGVRQAFGSDETTIVGVFAPDVFTPATLAKIDRASAQLAAIKGVREVISLTTVKGVDTDEEGLRVGRLMRGLPGTPEAAAAFRQKIMASPLYVGALVSADGGATAILVVYDLLGDDQFAARRVGVQVTEGLRALGGGPEQVAVTGLRTLTESGARMMRRDLRRLLPLAMLGITVVLAWAFQTKRGVLLPLGAMLIGMTWTAGAMGVAAIPLHLGTLVVPPFVLALGIAYAIHLVARYYQRARPGLSRPTVVGTTVAAVAPPLGIAALTTVLGFSVLACSGIRVIRDLGLAAAIGTVAVFLVTFGFIPAMLMVLPDLRTRSGQHNRWSVRVLEWTGRRAVAHRRLVLGGFAGLAALSLWGTTWIHVETDYLSFFGPRSRARLDNARIAERLGGTQPIYLVVDGSGPGTVTRLETLAAVRDLQAFVRQLPGVDSTLSLADYLAVAHGALNPDAAHRFPATQAEIEQLLLFISPSDVRHVVTADFSRANVVVRTHLSGSAAVMGFVRTVEAEARSRFPRSITVRASGAVPLLNGSAEALAHAQLASLTQMLVALLVLMSLMFLSVRAGVVSLVPNILPVVLLFGVMGWTGMPVNVTTSMIAVIAIAITVTDTIHYLSALNVEIQRSGSETAALHKVAGLVGRPIVFTAIALGAGFLVFSVSSFEPIHRFGVLASITMGLALATGLLVTPALVVVRRVVTLWDLLRLRLGPRPHEEIPLFAGLRPFQAKLVVLMGRLATAPPGHFIARRGEMKPELYVLLNGRAEVRPPAGEPVIRVLGRGDVIGEMGLVRERQRSADVVVAETAEYLVLDAVFLRRIRRRYPRVAATVFLNLARILSDRLETATNRLTGDGDPTAAEPTAARYDA